MVNLLRSSCSLVLILPCRAECSLLATSSGGTEVASSELRLYCIAADRGLLGALLVRSSLAPAVAHRIEGWCIVRIARAAITPCTVIFTQ